MTGPAGERLPFRLLSSDGAARAGILATAHGEVRTPAFMPVGTAGTVKAMTPDAITATGAELILCNTYHLMLRPGVERVAALGGLHRFANWHGPILTDSGGFQVMSLAALREVRADGVTFKSHLDGTMIDLTPARCIEMQAMLGVDIAMVLDECTAYPADYGVAAKAMQLSMTWAARCREAYDPVAGHGLFGIVQGGVHAALRETSAAALVEIGFEGYAVGGLAVGEGPELMLATLDATLPCLPLDRPRYLMGVGRPTDIVAAVERGIDLFDCVLPTRSGRTGQAFTRFGAINIRNARHAEDPRPLDTECGCPACTGHSRAYLHHLVRSKEILGAILLTWHNLQYYQDLMAGLRAAIGTGALAGYAEQFRARQDQGDIAPL
jgi:queuine tRNA-ribosyltransferase